MSLLLSWMLTDPSGCMTAKSPLWKYPPLKAFSVALSSVKYWRRRVREANTRHVLWNVDDLFHHKVPTNDNFAKGLPISRDVLEIFAFCLINDTGAVGSGVAVTLSGHKLCTFVQRKGER